MGEAAFNLDPMAELKRAFFFGVAKGIKQDRVSYPDFIPQAWPLIEPSTPLVPNWHLDCIAEHLEAVITGEIQDLVINLPPRNGKSNAVTVLWPAWAWTQQPGLKWIFVSYAASLSTKHSIDRRRIIESEWFQDRWGSLVRLQPDQNKTNVYENTARGVMFATSVGGSATGFGADIMIFDDTINPRQAESKAEREKSIQAFDLTFASRLNDKKRGHKIIVEQRLHKDDLTGHVLKRSGWTHLNLPAIAEERTKIIFPMSGRVVERKAGDVLNPEREALPELLRAKEANERVFAAQYQQHPSADEAAYFKRDRWKFYTLPPEEMAKNCTEQIQSWDLTFKDAAASDYVVGGVVGVRGPDFIVLDVVRARMSFTASKVAFKSLSAKWPRAHAKLVEDKANGPAAVDEWSREVGGIIPVEPEGSKIERAAAVSPYQEAGNVYLPDPKFAPWVHEFIEELADFPGGSHDDQVDFLSQALRWFINKRNQRTVITVI